MLKIYNSLHNRKEEFVPIEPNKIRLYVCGMTVYDYCHLGHARVMVVFDMVYRYLQTAGYDVTYVRNITDIDDKIIKRAIENNEPFTQLTTRFIDAMHEDEAALGILKPAIEPRATDNIPEMLDMISQLIEKGYAYVGNNNDVYYSVAKFEGYGKLSGRKLEDLRAGERIAVDQVKQDPLDFVLWKAAKPDEPAWDSPWGRGRPGWHIECSAMSQKILGDRFDIHGGGQDLQFPHHENEIAQSEGCTGHQTVNYWMHNGFIRINDEKMSKSLGNFSTIREVLKEHKPEVIRYFMLSTHYRKPLNYDTAPLQDAKNSLDKFYNFLKSNSDADISPLENSQEEADFLKAMNDDFNTPKATAVLYELIHKSNAETNPQSKAQIAALMKKLGGVLGLFQQNPEDWFKTPLSAGGIDEEAIEALIQQRAEARSNKDWAACDALRDTLKAKGIVLEDGPGGTSWRRG